MIANREVLTLVFEFMISLVVLLGGGFMIFSGKAQSESITAIMMVLTYWFAKRSFEAGQNKKAPEAVDTTITPTNGAVPK